MRYIFWLLSVCFLFAFVIETRCAELTESKTPVFFMGEPGESRLCFEDEGEIINGWDSYGATYYFIPSYLQLNRIDYGKSGMKLYSADGRILEQPVMGEMQEVLVEAESGELEPYRVGFFQSANLYTLTISMNGSDMDDVRRDEYKEVSFSLISQGGKRVYEDSDAYIKGRGNSSWDKAKKKSYELKLSKEASLLNMSKSDKWTLLSNSFDKTKLCNKMVFDTSYSTGMEYAIESDWVDVFIDGNYAGNYLLCKEPGIGEGELDIGNLQLDNKSDYNGIPFNDGKIKGYDYKRSRSTDISGGYLMAVDFFPEKRRCGFYLDNDVFFDLKSPNNASRDEMEYIDSYISNIDDDIRDIADKEGRFPDDVDAYSFARRYLLEEVFFNRDALCASYYFYKKKGQDILYAGPCWDYDQLYLVSYDPSLVYTESILNNARISDVRAALDWDELLLQNEDYQAYVHELYKRFEENWDRVLNNRIDTYYDKIRKSVEMDYARWSEIYDKEEGIHLEHYDLPYSNVRYLKHSLYLRLKYLGEQWGVDLKIHDPDECNGAIHSITFIDDKNTVILPMEDGETMTKEKYNQFFDSEDGAWINVKTKEELSPDLPVYEDMEFYFNRFETR